MFQEFCEDIFFIEGELEGRYPHSNSLLITGDKENILIDTGTGGRKLRKLKKQYSIDLVILSHHHEDHTSGLKYFKNSKICIHLLDKEGVESIKYLQKIYGFEDPKYDNEFNIFISSFGLKEVKVDNVFQDKEIFDLGNVKIEVIHTPGHSAGHCCFWIHPYNIIFLSDIDLTSFGPFYGSIDGDISDFIDSIEKIMKFNTKIAVSSHKGIFRENINEKLKQFLKKFDDRDNIILENLRQPQTLDSLTEKALIYGKFPDQAKEMFIVSEKLMLEKHLKRLVENNLIQEKNGFYFI